MRVMPTPVLGRGQKASAGRTVQPLGRAVPGGVLVLIPGVLGIVSGMLWLFPSLGPSYFIQVQTPQQRAAQPYSVVGGHLIGIATGYLAVIALGGLAGIPSALSAHQLLPAHVLASGLGIGLMILVQLLVGAGHPPAAATAPLITLSGSRLMWLDLSWLLAGIAIMAITGEVARRWVLSHAEREPVGG